MLYVRWPSNSWTWWRGRSMRSLWRKSNSPESHGPMTTRFQNKAKCSTSLFTINIFRASSMGVILAMMLSMRRAKTPRVMETKSCTTIGMLWPLASDTYISVWGFVCATFHSNWLGLAHLKSRTFSVSNSLSIPSGWLAVLSAIVAGREWERGHF